MAEKKSEASSKQENTAPVKQVNTSVSPKNKKDSKNPSLLFGIMAVLTALIIMVAAFGGVFYFVIHNNINGLAERYRAELQGVPILKLALPPAKDPDDPKNLSLDDLKVKYNQFRISNQELTKQLEDTTKKLKELETIKDEADKAKAENDTLKKQMEDLKKQQEEEKKKIDEIVASGNKDAFKEYYAKVNKETADKIYKEIMTEQKANQDEKSFAQIYEKMDSAQAAKILEELSTSNVDLSVNILKNMKKDVAALVLGEMSALKAASLTDLLAKKYNIILTPKK